MLRARYSLKVLLAMTALVALSLAWYQKQYRVWKLEQDTIDQMNQYAFSGVGTSAMDPQTECGVRSGVWAYTRNIFGLPNDWALFQRIVHVEIIEENNKELIRHLENFQHLERLTLTVGDMYAADQIEGIVSEAKRFIETHPEIEYSLHVAADSPDATLEWGETNTFVPRNFWDNP